MQSTMVSVNGLIMKSPKAESYSDNKGSSNSSDHSTEEGGSQKEHGEDVEKGLCLDDGKNYPCIHIKHIMS